MYEKEFAAILSVSLTAISYGHYIFSISRGKTKPPALSWIIWTILMFIGAAIQMKEHGGLGSYATAFCGLGCLTISIIALFYGKKDIKRGDWVSFGIAIGIIPIWHLTSSPLIAAILISLINAFAFSPTFAKAYYNPFEENPITFGISSLSNTMILAALSSYSWSATLYPMTMLFLNTALALLIFIRRKMCFHEKAISQQETACRFMELTHMGLDSHEISEQYFVAEEKMDRKIEKDQGVNFNCSLAK
ncbi:MAG: hypothetical protein PHX43_00475 [Alphaproteobacteria bacterium]|nr:hypothetical protein [Alphaproteobacteria bacterium]